MNRAERRAAERAAGKAVAVDQPAPMPQPGAPAPIVSTYGIIVNVAMRADGTGNASVAAVYGQMHPLDVVKALQAAAAGIAQQLGSTKLVGADGVPLVS